MITYKFVPVFLEKLLGTNLLIIRIANQNSSLTAVKAIYVVGQERKHTNTYTHTHNWNVNPDSQYYQTTTTTEAATLLEHQNNKKITPSSDGINCKPQQQQIRMAYDKEGILYYKTRTTRTSFNFEKNSNDKQNSTACN